MSCSAVQCFAVQWKSLNLICDAEYIGMQRIAMGCPVSKGGRMHISTHFFCFNMSCCGYVFQHFAYHSLSFYMWLATNTLKLMPAFLKTGIFHISLKPAGTILLSRMNGYFVSLRRLPTANGLMDFWWTCRNLQVNLQVNLRSFDLV